jgi:hypothetical protein
MHLRYKITLRLFHLVLEVYWIVFILPPLLLILVSSCFDPGPQVIISQYSVDKIVIQVIPGASHDLYRGFILTNKAIYLRYNQYNNIQFNTYDDYIRDLQAHGGTVLMNHVITDEAYEKSRYKPTITINLKQLSSNDRSISSIYLLPYKYTDHYNSNKGIANPLSVQKFTIYHYIIINNTTIVGE